MKDLRKYRPTLVAILFALALLLAAPTAMFAQGRGHGFGRGRGRGPDLNKKCGKFVNCHDARNGREAFALAADFETIISSSATADSDEITVA